MTFAQDLISATTVDQLVEAFKALVESERSEAKVLAASSPWAWRLFAHRVVDLWPQKAEQWNTPATPLAVEFAHLNEWEFNALLRGARGEEVKSFVIGNCPPKEGVAVPVRNQFVFPDGSINAVHGAPARELSFEVPHPGGWVGRQVGVGTGSLHWFTGEDFQVLGDLKLLKPGTLLVSPEVMTSYGRHPQDGWARLSWQFRSERKLVAIKGAAIERRFDLIAKAIGRGLPVPETAYWFEADIVGEKPVLVERKGGAKKALVKIGMKNAERKTLDPTFGAKATNGRVLWDAWGSTKGWGIQHAVVLTVLNVGGVLTLPDGREFVFDGAVAKETELAAPVEPVKRVLRASFSCLTLGGKLEIVKISWKESSFQMQFGAGDEPSVEKVFGKISKDTNWPGDWSIDVIRKIWPKGQWNDTAMREHAV